MYAIEVTTEFCASHQLRLPNGSLEPLHGHNWRITLRITAQKLDALETVLDFHDVERALQQHVLPWNNCHLNDLDPFKDGAHNPSAERVAEEIARRLTRILTQSPDATARQVRISEVRVTEAPHCAAVWLAD
jgi:6-pyruvoyltetrahydropterin/6-carboxytetrahydropterin synthase